MSNVLSNEQRQQILALGRTGMDAPAHRTGDREPPRDGQRLSEGGGAGGPRPRAAGDTGGKTGHFPGRLSTDSAAAHPATTGAVSTDAVPPGRAPPASACEPFRERIEAALTQGRNAVAIYQDLVSDHGCPASYASVRRFVRRLRGRRSVEARVVITTAPGEEGQVDDGSGPMVRDPHSGRDRRTRLLAFTLGYSRKSVRLLVWRSTTQIWAELHERAFRRLGGTVRVVVHDNLREGVLTPDIYDPTLTPLYRDVLAHDRVIALPCRVRDPDRTGTVEARIGHAQKTPLKGLRFETRIGAQAYLDRWEPAGPTPGSTARPPGRSRRCLPRNARRWGRSRSSRFATTATASGPCTSTAVSRSRRPPTVHRPGGSGSACRCSGTGPGCGSWPPPPGASPLAPRLAAHPRRGPAGADAPLHPHAARPRHTGRARHWHPLRAHPPA